MELDFNQPCLEDRMNEEYPLTDYVGTVADKATRSQIVILTSTSIILLVLLVMSGAISFSLYTQPSKIIYVRLDEVGRATPIEYSGLQYTPKDGEIMQQLYKFAELRFSRLKSTVIRDYSNSYYFIDGSYAPSLKSEDAEITKVATGEMPESAVNVKHVQITSLGREKFGNIILYAGTAQIQTENVSVANSEKQNRVVSVKFYLNQDSVAKLTQKHPEYVYINPLGVVITEFHVAGY